LVRDAFPNELDTMYNNFENTNNLLTLDGVLPYFNNNQATMANETFYNEDSMYKYILPYRAGFIIDEETAEELGIEAGDRLYAA
jgi:anaerobic selenocysteine-containing dehydrogenase